MSFDKQHPGRKDWRKPLKGSEAFDESCRSHGGCSWCAGNRMIQEKRIVPADIDEQLIAHLMEDGQFAPVSLEQQRENLEYALEFGHD